MSRVVMGEHLLGSMNRKNKKRKRLRSSEDRNAALKWTHEIATCSADFVGEWDGEWESCALLGKIGQMCHVVCRVDEKDVFVPEHLVRPAQNGQQRDDTTSASEWYDMFCKRDHLKPSEMVVTELIKLSEKTTKLCLRDVLRDVDIFNAVRAVLKSRHHRSKKKNIHPPISRLEICGSLFSSSDRKKEFLELLREINHLSALCLECHCLGPEMTRRLLRYVVEETKIRDLEISFDSMRRGIARGLPLKSSLSSIRRLSLRACNLIDLDAIL